MGNGRIESATGVYHVYNRGNEKKAIYEMPKERDFMMKCLANAKQECNVKIFSYCIMPNHYHLVLEAELKQLAAFIQLAQSKYGATYHYYHHQEGYVFQGRYKSKPVLTKEYFWTLMRYIHLNPVKAHLTASPEDYAWSSFAEYTAKAPVYQMLDSSAVRLYKQQFPDMKNFYLFHGQPDITLYDDIEEELAQQEIEREAAALKDLTVKYGFYSWKEAGEDKERLVQTVSTLYETYQFDAKRLSKLLQVSKYHVNKALNAAGIFN